MSVKIRNSNLIVIGVFSGMRTLILVTLCLSGKISYRKDAETLRKIISLYLQLLLISSVLSSNLFEAEAVPLAVFAFPSEILSFQF